MRLAIEHMLLEGAHQGALFAEVGLAQHLVVEIDRPLVLKLAVVGTVGWQVSLHVEQRVDDATAESHTPLRGKSVEGTTP